MKLIKHFKSPVLATSLAGALALIAISTSGCENKGSKTGKEVIYSVYNATSAATITARFGIVSENVSVGAIPIGSISCVNGLNADSPGAGDLTVKDGTSGNVIGTILNPVNSNDLGPWVVLLYGAPYAVQAETINLMGGAGSSTDLWVSDLSQNNTKNLQVTVIDKATGGSTQVTPVSGAVNMRTRFETPLSPNHAYTVSLSDATGVVASADVTTPAGSDSYGVLATFEDVPSSTKQRLTFHIVSQPTVAAGCTN